jgi:hypothetical protein
MYTVLLLDICFQFLTIINNALMSHFVHEILEFIPYASDYFLWLDSQLEISKLKSRRTRFGVFY